MTGKQRLALAISATLSIAGTTGCSTISELKTTSISNTEEEVIVHHIAFQKEQRADNEINALAKKLGLGKFAPTKVQKKTYFYPQIRHATYNKIQPKKAVLRKKTITRRKIPPVKSIVTHKAPKPLIAATNLSAFEREVNRLYATEKVTTTPQQVSRNSLWSRITNGYCLNAGVEKPLVQKILNQYALNPQHLNRIFDRSGQYLHFILHELNRRKMPTELALLPMVESAYDNSARSRSGGTGLWQLGVAKGKQLSLKQTHNYDARLDVFTSTIAILDTLQRLNKKFSGDWSLTLASYKVGERRVQHEITKNRLRGKPTDYWHLDLPREAKEYIPQLLAYREILLRPHSYGLNLPVVTNTPQLMQVIVNKSVDLRKVAHATGLPSSTLTSLNLKFKNAITNPSLSRKVVLPRLHASKLHQAIRLAPGVSNASYKTKNQSKRYLLTSSNNTKIQLVNYRVRTGENLYKIALKYGTTVTKIMRLNGLRNTQIKAGLNLKIAVKSSSAPVKHV